MLAFFCQSLKPSPRNFLPELHRKTHFKAATSIYMNHPGTLRDDDKLMESKFKLIKNLPHFQNLQKQRMLLNESEYESSGKNTVRELPPLETSILCKSAR